MSAPAFLICVPVADLPDPYGPSSTSACGCPCGCQQLMWIAEQIPAGTVPLCLPCLTHVEPDPDRLRRDLLATRDRIARGLS